MRILPRPTWVLSVIAFLVFATILVVDGTVRGGVGVPPNKPAGKSSPSDIRRALVPRKPARRESPRHGLGAGGHLKELKDGLGAKSHP